MSTPRPDKSALPDSSYHWTTVKARVFLGALAHFGSVAEAAREVGMGRQSVYRLRKRLGEDGLFAKSWDRALAQGREKRRASVDASRRATVLPPESDIFGLGK
jgi:transposase-like protein